MNKLFSETKPVSALSATELATMFGLLSIEFLGVSRHDFLQDLEEKEAVMLLRIQDSHGEIVGFSTIMLLELPIASRKVTAVFSGDTTVLPQYRHSTGFGVEIGRYFLSTIESFPGHEVYYVLISKGWRTYKILPFFFKEFSPAYDSVPKHEDKEVIDAFGMMKYPKEYNQSKGLIIFSKETQRLIPGSIDALPRENPDQHIRYFMERNPTYLSGTELVCVAPVRESNFTPAFRRILRPHTQIGG